MEYHQDACVDLERMKCMPGILDAHDRALWCLNTQVSCICFAYPHQLVMRLRVGFQFFNPFLNFPGIMLAHMLEPLVNRGHVGLHYRVPGVLYVETRAKLP